MPTLLAVAAIGLTTACPDPSGNESTAANEGASDGGEPDCMIAEPTDCEAVDGCTWSPQIDICVIDCAPLDDPTTCEDAEFCEWSEDHCEHHAI